ncbi:hypothetical protein [Jiella pelagia]|uniref:Uncharacterized protein n=1 Tax=Jiella pelagia TaxID=2986949 RepID=A0ABY7C3J5_9HYPH|nr:hypothetical protein [Jiella pelagia]WAP70377.1 hypothetical protein OH818_10075 [Jiella pelagia]
MGNEIKIQILNISDAERSKTSGELLKNISDAAQKFGVSGEITLNKRRDRDDTQDLGATIIAVIGTSAAIAIAKGIADFIRKRGDTVTVVKDEITITFTGTAASSDSIEKIASIIRELNA